MQICPLIRIYDDDDDDVDDNDDDDDENVWFQVGNSISHAR